MALTPLDDQLKIAPPTWGQPAPGMMGITSASPTPQPLSGATSTVATPQQTITPGIQGFSPKEVVGETLSYFTDQNNPYMRNAARRGLEVAGARGLSNSSIAAGASQRAALEAAQPLVNNAMALLGEREGRAFQGQQADLDRAFRERMQSDSVLQQDWLSSNNFTREFNGTLALMPIKNAYDLSKAIMSYAADNPEVFTPEVMSGFGNFFQNMPAMLLNQGGG